MLKLLFARPSITFPATKYRRVFASTKLYKRYSKKQSKQSWISDLYASQNKKEANQTKAANEKISIRFEKSALSVDSNKNVLKHFHDTKYFNVFIKHVDNRSQAARQALHST